MIDWSTLESAIAAWVRAGSGLGIGQVIWAAQDGPRPATPYISIATVSIVRVGQDWADTHDAPSPAPGAEIEFRARGSRVVTLSLQCYATEPTGASMAMAILENVVASAVLPTHNDNLDAAGFGVSNFDPVSSISGVINSSNFEPRAATQVRGFVSHEITELGTYIETVELTDQIVTPPYVFTVP